MSSHWDNHNLLENKDTVDAVWTRGIEDYQPSRALFGVVAITIFCILGRKANPYNDNTVVVLIHSHYLGMYQTFPDTKTIAFPSLPAIERSKTDSYWTSIYKQKTSGSENKGLHLFDDLCILSRTGIDH